MEPWEMDWTGVKVDATTPGKGKPLTKDQRAANTFENDVKTAIRQLDETERLYNRNLKGSGVRSIMEYLPTQGNAQYDASVEALAPLLKPLIRRPGEGTFTDADQALLNNLLPGRTSMDAKNEQRLKQIRAMAYGALGKPVPKRTAKQKIIDFNSLPE